MHSPSDKAALRRTLLASRQLVAPEVRREWDEKIADHVYAWWRRSGVHTLGVYWPIRGEPELHALYRRLREHGALLALPRVVEKEAPLVFAAWNEDQVLQADAHGVPVPGPDAPLLKPQALLIPCVGFNHLGQRLGYGGGYYDRTLAQAPRPLAIGIAYAISECAFDGGPHDLALDRVITERR
jgi:5-formyltetrahydrofolate cyclo-ligase